MAEPWKNYQPEGPWSKRRGVARGEKPSSSKTGSFLRGVADGALAGFADEIGGYVGSALGPSSTEEFFTGRPAEDETARIRAQMQADAQQHPVMRGAGQIGGGVASSLAIPGSASARLLPSVAASMAYGGAYGAGNADGGDRVKGAVRGAGEALAGDLVGRGLVKGAGRILAPKVDDAVATLKGAKVPLTIGRAIGGKAKEAEDWLSGRPIVGSAIRSRLRKSFEGVQRAHGADVLERVGKRLPKSVGAGHDLVDVTGGMISDAYTDALTPMRVAIPADFATKLHAMGAGLPKSQAEAFAYMVDNEIAPLLDGGVMTGEQLQMAKRYLAAEITKYSRATNTDSFLSKPLKKVHDAIFDEALTQNPDLVAAYRAADDAYANFIPMQKAAAKAAGKGGVPNANQMMTAVRESDRSVGKGMTARGKARGQTLAKAATEVLPATVGDSGTAGRIAFGEMLRNPHAAVGGLLASSLYSDPVQAALVAAAIKRTNAMRQAGQALPKFAAPAGLLGSVFASQK